MAKTCTSCGHSFPSSARYFHRNRRSRGGLVSQCKHCRAAKRRSGRDIDRERIDGLLRHARGRAEKYGVPFGIDADWIKANTPTTCPALGIPLFAGDDTHRDYSPSLDRLVPAKGYTPENTRVISTRANRIKSNATPTELRLVADWLEGETDGLP